VACGSGRGPRAEHRVPSAGSGHQSPQRPGSGWPPVGQGADAGWGDTRSGPHGTSVGGNCGTDAPGARENRVAALDCGRAGRGPAADRGPGVVGVINLPARQAPQSSSSHHRARGHHVSIPDRHPATPNRDRHRCTHVISFAFSRDCPPSGRHRHRYAIILACDGDCDCGDRRPNRDAVARIPDGDHHRYAQCDAVANGPNGGRDGHPYRDTFGSPPNSHSHLYCDAIARADPCHRVAHPRPHDRPAGHTRPNAPITHCSGNDTCAAYAGSRIPPRTRLANPP